MSGGGNLRLAPQGFQRIKKLCKKCYNSDIKHHCKNANGFTLAEVLITLGVIAVVAALTLPSLINKYKIKQLEVSFKKNSSMIANALNLTVNNFGYDDIQDIAAFCSAGQTDCPEKNKDLFTDINNYYLSQFDIVNTLSGNDLYRFSYTNYSGTKKGRGYNEIIAVNGFSNTVSPTSTIHILSNGMMISNIGFFLHWNRGDGITVAFDTNGPYKGPNRYGYDIFVYSTSKTSYTTCSSRDGLDPNQNGVGCYLYALKDLNPDDSTKGYWDSLY